MRLLFKYPSQGFTLGTPVFPLVVRSVHMLLNLTLDQAWANASTPPKYSKKIANLLISPDLIRGKYMGKTHLELDSSYLNIFVFGLSIGRVNHFFTVFPLFTCCPIKIAKRR